MYSRIQYVAAEDIPTLFDACAEIPFQEIWVTLSQDGHLVISIREMDYHWESDHPLYMSFTPEYACLYRPCADKVTYVTVLREGCVLIEAEQKIQTMDLIACFLKVVALKKISELCLRDDILGLRPAVRNTKDIPKVVHSVSEAIAKNENITTLTVDISAFPFSLSPHVVNLEILFCTETIDIHVKALVFTLQSYPSLQEIRFVALRDYNVAMILIDAVPVDLDVLVLHFDKEFVNVETGQFVNLMKKIINRTPCLRGLAILNHGATADGYRQITGFIGALARLESLILWTRSDIFEGARECYTAFVELQKLIGREEILPCLREICLSMNSAPWWPDYDNSMCRHEEEGRLCVPSTFYKTHRELIKHLLSDNYDLYKE